MAVKVTLATFKAPCPWHKHIALANQILAQAVSARAAQAGKSTYESWLLIQVIKTHGTMETLSRKSIINALQIKMGVSKN